MDNKISYDGKTISKTNVQSGSVKSKKEREPRSKKENPDKKSEDLCILQILKDHSSCDHQLGINNILDYLSEEHDIRVGRTAVTDKIKKLSNILSRTIVKDASTRKYYYQNPLDDGAIRMLIDSVIFSKNITAEDAGKLIKELTVMTTPEFREKLSYTKNFDKTFHTSNEDVMRNIEILTEAISKKVQVQFDYYVYEYSSGDKKIQFVKKNSSDWKYKVSPYQLLASNGRYYLLCNSFGYDHTSFYRVDRMKDVNILKGNDKKPIKVKPIRENKDLHNAQVLDMVEFQNRHVYMIGGPVIYVKMKISKGMIDTMLEWFGKNFTVNEEHDDGYIVGLHSNLWGIKFWALQYGDYVEVLSPSNLREDIRNTISEMVKKYK